MLIPGFVTIFADKEGKIHLYFFPGIDNYSQPYYNKLDLSDTKVKYTEVKHSDGACEFIFSTSKIIRVTCKLISKYNDVEYKTLYI